MTMSRKIWCAGIGILIAAVATAQTTPHKNAAKHPVTNNQHKTSKITADNAVNAKGSLFNTGSYKAKAGNRYLSGYNSLQIADPVIKIFNERANGYDTSFNRSGIIGVPKRTYGLANGHLVFRSSGATSSGTMTGSGSVGTGSSPGSMGMGDQVQGVNGKSPYAGPGMWGTKVAGPELRPDLPKVKAWKVEKKE